MKHVKLFEAWINEAALDLALQSKFLNDTKSYINKVGTKDGMKVIEDYINSFEIRDFGMRDTEYEKFKKDTKTMYDRVLKLSKASKLEGVELNDDKMREHVYSNLIEGGPLHGIVKIKKYSNPYESFIMSIKAEDLNFWIMSDGENYFMFFSTDMKNKMLK